MKKPVDFFISLFGIVCMCIATAVQAQSPNEVYRNEQIGIFIRAEGSEGGGDWMFVKATMFKAEVSFNYKGTTVTMTGYNSQRFLRKDYPFPAGLKLNDSQVMVDGYPATNYVEYLKYYDAMSKRVDAIGKNTNYDNKQSLEESITTIDNMIAEIKGKESTSQISDNFKKQQNLRYFIQKLEEKRQSLKGAITALEKKSQASTIMVTGTTGGVDKSNSSDKGNTGMRNDDFWNGGANKNSSSSKGTSDTATIKPEDDTHRTASQFKGGLDDIKEGGYFKNDRGEYFRKENGNAVKVDKSVYDQAQADDIRKRQEEQERQAEELAVKLNTMTDVLATSFYTNRLADDLKSAGRLSGQYESVEDLNAAFREQLHTISRMGNELQNASVQNVQAYTSVVGASSTGYDYSAITGAIGSIAASISAGNAERKARESLIRERNEEEARINAEKLEALVAMRQQIGKVFVEGGMPLTSHKVTAPALYVFAYSSNKAEWENNQAVLMSVSNIIPVYRYNDGTYPYTSNVKRIFENVGLSNPILMGYFTNETEAEKYRRSLLDVAPSAKFTVKEVEVKVKEQKANSTSNASETDFWGIKSTTKKQETSQNTASDFWGTPTKDKKIETKTETKKENDFWSK